MISFARWEQRPQLAALWRTSFDEPHRPTNFFFNNAFLPENCLVYESNGHVAAMLHMLPLHVATKGGPVQGHYIYAAATLPEHRGHGCMASLLAYAALAGTQRGDHYSVVLPADPGLYSLYEKAEYGHLYRQDTLELSRGDLRELSGGKRPQRQLPDYRALVAARNGLLADRPGSVLWNERDLAYADGINRVYGGSLFCVCENGEWAYALCRPAKDKVEVTELAATCRTLPALCAVLLARTHAESYSFRLAAGCGLFQKAGTRADFGLIRPLGGAPGFLAENGAPYLGLALD